MPLFFPVNDQELYRHEPQVEEREEFSYSERERLVGAIVKNNRMYSLNDCKGI
jgi:hypothetical protein